eukprot:1518785-Amphidinium_carterae.2
MAMHLSCVIHLESGPPSTTLTMRSQIKDNQVTLSDPRLNMSGGCSRRFGSIAQLISQYNVLQVVRMPLRLQTSQIMCTSADGYQRYLSLVSKLAWIVVNFWNKVLIVFFHCARTIPPTNKSERNELFGTSLCNAVVSERERENQFGQNGRLPSTRAAPKRGSTNAQTN